jgi:hypothetical protein
MAVILLGERIEFPTATVRAHLREHAGHYHWQCGERDEGGTSDKDSFDRPQLTLGRVGGDVVMINAAQHDAPFADGGEVPLHRHYITISHPTLDDPYLANRLRFAFCLGLIQNKMDAAIRCQLLPGGAWLDANQMRDAVALVANGAEFSSLGQPGSTELPSVAAFVAPQPAESPQLAPLILLLSDRVALDWAQIAELIDELDPAGRWHVKCEPHGRGFLQGRGGMIALQNPDAPLAGPVIDESLSRSWWFDGDTAAAASHRSQLIISSTFEDDAAPQDQQAAIKIVSLIACIASHHDAVVGVYHAGHGTIFSPASVVDMLVTVADNEIPLALWTKRALAVAQVGAASQPGSVTEHVPEPAPESEFESVPEPTPDLPAPCLPSPPIVRAAGGFGRKGL